MFTLVGNKISFARLWVSTRLLSAGRVAVFSGGKEMPSILLAIKASGRAKLTPIPLPRRRISPPPPEAAPGMTGVVRPLRQAPQILRCEIVSKLNRRRHDFPLRPYRQWRIMIWHALGVPHVSHPHRDLV